MVKRVLSILVVLVFSVGGLVAQSDRIPTDLSDVVRRAQQLRMLLATGRLVESLPLILPDSQDELLSAGKTIFQNPKVIGLDLTEDPDRVIVRFSVESPMLNTGSTSTPWVARDPWVRVDGQWYFDGRDLGGTLESESRDGNPEAALREISEAFEMPSYMELGTFLQDEVHVIPVPIEHSAEGPVGIDIRIPSRLVGLEVSSVRFIEPGTPSFNIVVDTSDFVGALQFLLALRINYKGVSIDRNIMLQGNVVAPLTLELNVPSDESVSDGELRYILRNNSDRVAKVNYLSVSGQLEIIDHSDIIGANEEGFVHLSRRQGLKAPDRLDVWLKEPIYGKMTYSLRLDIPPY